ncbi:hypothetical protein SUGI_0238350 [Cryptomeria japonica]|uniref:mini-chromosome maintenance complex-binding protein n=1 Tax=Cryptomeria japonica TaxID=3369 RepID=UPI002408A892|nr:mini-chromosome maintenance complex-binding protein [Cryptomeria japonica]GLJ14702.1 hypothetical protein SUGI_0238350 [Cryptomeria japonica]
MGGPAFDCLSNPLGTVRFMFEKAISAGADPSKLNKSDWGTIELFQKFVYQDGGLQKVPEINQVKLDSIPPNSLVRFRGIVQDMFDSEFYVGVFKDGSTWRTNKYADMASVQMPPDAQVEVWDRRLLYCVPVPGENTWVRDAPCKDDACSNGTPPQQREKRQREPSTSTEDSDMTSAESQDSNEAKRKREEDSSSSSSPMETCERKPNQIEFDPNMPLGETNLLPCLVKMYDCMDAELKLNDIVEFIGVLTFDPELTTPSNDQDAMAHTFIDEDVLSHLPASKVPRLHSIVYRKLSTSSLVSLSNHSEVHLRSLPIKELRESLLQGLKAVFGGDELAAHYFLLHILSQIHARVEPVALGKFSLNLTKIQGGSNMGSFIELLNEAIKELVPCSHFLSLTIEYLNRSSVAPRKNYQTNRLSTGVLQLASGTHLTIDETQLKAGTLNSTGVENVQIFRDLLEWQKVGYDFEYYTMDMPTDIQVLVLSDGKSNIFPADIVVPFRPTSEFSPLSACRFSKQQWRLYLSTMKSYEHTIGKDMQQLLENDMVAARQRDRSVGPEVFGRWLTMARLVSLSFGEKTMSMDHWQIVKDLERQRSERLG